MPNHASEPSHVGPQVERATLAPKLGEPQVPKSSDRQVSKSSEPQVLPASGIVSSGTSDGGGAWGWRKTNLCTWRDSETGMPGWNPLLKGHRGSILAVRSPTHLSSIDLLVAGDLPRCALCDAGRKARVADSGSRLWAQGTTQHSTAQHSTAQHATR
ncbi:hypothetical protein VDGL01_01005 [Verticillium dahliae]